MSTYHNEEKTPATGIAGTILGSIGTAGAIGLFNGGLGGLFGGNRNVYPYNDGFRGDECLRHQVLDLTGQVASLKSERYTDNKDETLRDSLLKNWLKPLADEAAKNMVNIEGIRKDVAANKEIAALEVKLAEERVRTEHARMQGAVGLIDQRLRCVENKLDCVGSFKIRNSGVCPGWGDVTIAPAAADVVTGG